MHITFDPNKNTANPNKHGVSLTEGDGVLNDPLALTIEDNADMRVNGALSQLG